MKGLFRAAAGAALILASVAPFAAPAAMAQDDPRTSAATGYSIADDAVWNFYASNGGNLTFGEPISREFTLFGKPTQLFENAALQVQPDGGVLPLQLADPSYFTASTVDGLTVPPADAAMAFVAPTPADPNYMARLGVFLQATVPDRWNGTPVNFYSTFSNGGGTAVWGLPTSSPKADPNNPNFVYQRFQNGILFYDASSGTTGALPLGDYLKTQLTSDSPLLKVAAATQTDLSEAFQPDVS
jgi:hypothetical protein